jgi:hypothetical protein
VRVALETNVLPGIIATGKKCQRPLKAGVGSGCVSETNANTPTSCSNRVFAMPFGVLSTRE